MVDDNKAWLTVILEKESQDWSGLGLFGLGLI